MILKTKKCSKCKEIKSIAKFSMDKQRRDGHAYVCKTCKDLEEVYELMNRIGKENVLVGWVE